ncbi:MAG: hypothetical protein IJF94_04660 [Eubacterium sp.]|nr:hypothetical protein [Eubacterium sp.]
MKKIQSSAIKSVLEKELDQNSKVLLDYLEKLNTLPKGTVVKRKIGNQDYCYLNYRSGDKVISEYLGKSNSEKVTEIEEQVLERKRLFEIVKRLRKEEKELKELLEK